MATNIMKLTIFVLLLTPLMVQAKDIDLKFFEQDNGLYITSLKTIETPKGLVIQGILKSKNAVGSHKGNIQLELFDENNIMTGVENISYQPNRLAKRTDPFHKPYRLKESYIHFESKPFENNEIKSILIKAN